MLGAFDIETVGLGGEILAVGWQVEGDPKPTLSTDPMDLINAMVRRSDKRVIWYGHNAGGFDLLHLLPYLRQTGAEISPIWQGRHGRCIGMVIKRGRERTELRDSFAMVPSSLAKMASALCPELPKMVDAIDFETETYDHSNPTHRAYLTRDVESLLAAMIRLWEITRDTFGVWPRWTLGSTALSAWTLTLGESEVYWPMRRVVEDFARLAYFGGLVFLRYFGMKFDISAADVNAMYPSVMRANLFPVGVPWGVCKFDTQRLGIYHVKVFVPFAVKLPIVPLRHKAGVRWPTGWFETYITTPEIKYARELGCVVDILEGYVWPDMRHLFTEFVNSAETLRRDHVADAIGLIVKYLQNALYGKFGARREAEETLITDDMMGALEDGWRIVINPKTAYPVDGVYTRNKEIDASYIQPHWACYVTAYARIRLHRLVMAVGIDRVWYGDTDSVWADSEAITDALASGRVRGSPWHYGDVKIEGPYYSVEFIASKVYCVRDVDNRIAMVKAKGIPNRKREKSFLDRSVQVQWESMTTMHGLLTGTETLSGMRKRSWSDIRSSQSWKLADDGESVLPVHVDQAADAMAAEETRKGWEARQEALDRLEARRSLRRQIMAAGGLRPNRDYQAIPRSLRRRSGNSPDKVAAEIGYDSADDLFSDLVALWG